MRYLYRCLLFVFMLFPATAFSADLGMVRLSLIEGDVQVMIQDSTDWTGAAINLPLSESDRLWIPDAGKAELHIRGGIFVRADENTALDILTITSDSAQIYLGRGHVYINNRRGGSGTVQVDTPLSSLRSYDDSVMMVDVSEDGVTEVSVLKGYIYAESRAGATRVNAGNSLTIRGENDADLAPISSPGEWERWNTERDQRLTAWRESSRYLPDELHEYSAEFDAHGRWEYVGEYGYVWTPTAVVSTWVPYSVGRWIWIRGHYVWVAYDPWCWAPCHYGRWVYVSSYGWSWVPPARGAVYWGPGFVGWTVTPAYVAWVPLAPGEIYYGYGYFGPWSENIATVNVSTVVVNRTYVNARVRNSVVVVERESFGTGRRIPVKSRDNPFIETRQQNITNVGIVPPQVKPREPISIAPRELPRQEGRRPPERKLIPREMPGTRHGATPTPTTPTTPTIKPERREQPAVSPPAVVQPRERMRPPERVRQTRPDELKRERRVVKERDASVFQANPPEDLTVRKLNEPRTIIRKPAQQPQPAVQQKKKGKDERRDRQQERRSNR